MARRTFFSFHYEADVWRAALVRNNGVVAATSAAGFTDASIWEEAKSKGDAALRKLIKAGLEHTTVMVVLIGEKTARRASVNYEIEQSIARGNGMLAIYIDGIKDQNGDMGTRGAISKTLSNSGARTYVWDRDRFGVWVKTAAKAAGKR
jgi:MTH538 TIR-like domain (DUF1863)